MADLGTLLLRLAADAGQFESDLGRAARIAEKRGQEIERRFKAVGSVATAAFAATAAATTALVARAVEQADAMGKAAQSSGIAVESLSRLNHAAKLSDVSLEQLQTGVVALTKRMSEGSAAFEAIGVSVRDSTGNLRGADAVIADVAGVFANLEDGAMKTRLAVDLFGRAGAALIPLLNNGKAGLAAMGEEAERLGAVIDKKTAAQAERFNDQITKLGVAFDGIFLKVAQQVLPILDDLAGKFSDQKFQEGFVAIATGAATATAKVTELVAGLASLVKFAGEELSARIGGVDSRDVTRLEQAVDRQRALLAKLDQVGTGAERRNTSAYATEQREALAKLEAQLKTARKAVDDHAMAQARLAQGLKGAAGDTGVLSEAEKQAAAVKAELEQRLQSYINSLNVTSPALEKVAKSTDEATTEAKKLYTELQRIVDPTEDLNRLLADQAAQLGGPGVAALNAYNDELALIAELERDLLSLGPMSIESIEKLAQARANALTKYQDELAARTDEATREFESIWLRASENVGDALTTALLDGADAGADAIKNVMEQLARDLINMWARQQIIIPLQARMSGQTGNFGGFGPMTNGQYTGSNTAFGSSVFGNAAGQWFGGNTGWAAAGNVGGAIGGIYGVYDAYRNGPGGGSGALQGAAAGAAAGTAIMPGIGTLIGAVVGLLAGYFGGGEPTIRVSDRENDARASSRLDDVIGVARDRMPEGTATRFAQGIAQFDNAIAGMLDSFSEGAEQILEIRERLQNWSIRVEGDEATVENVLNERLDVMLAAFDETVQEYVGSAGAVEERVQRLADALAMMDLLAGELVPDFDALAELLEEYRVGTEAMGAVYQRVAASTAMLEEALGIMGVSLDLSRMELIRFATDISEAAGGTERAGQLWGSYFQNFYTEAERMALALSRAVEDAAAQFEDIGLIAGEFSTSEGMQRFRHLFEAVLPTLTAAQVAQWLEAANALGIAINAQAAYNAVLGQTAGGLEAIVRGGGSTGIGGENALPPIEVGGSPVGGGLEIIIPPIVITPTDPGDWGPSPGGIGGDLDREIERRYQMELDWLERLLSLQDSLLLDDRLSTLTPAEMLAEAQRQYEAALAGSMTGDARSREIYDAATRAYLEQARDFFASSDAYQAIFDRVQGDIGGLIAASPVSQAAAIASAEVSAAAAVSELQGLREDADDQTEAMVAAIASLEQRTSQHGDLLRDVVRELRKFNQQTRTST